MSNNDMFDIFGSEMNYGMPEEAMLGGRERNCVTVRKVGVYWLDEHDAPVKAERSSEGYVYIVDGAPKGWDGPIYGGEFLADPGAAEAAGMIEAA